MFTSSSMAYPCQISKELEQYVVTNVRDFHKLCALQHLEYQLVFDLPVNHLCAHCVCVLMRVFYFQAPPTVYYIPDFITEVEEQYLLQEVETSSRQRKISYLFTYLSLQKNVKDAICSCVECTFCELSFLSESCSILYCCRCTKPPNLNGHSCQEGGYRTGVCSMLSSFGLCRSNCHTQMSVKKNALL